MKFFHGVAMVVAFASLLLPLPAFSDAESEQLREQFAGIVKGLNDNSFEKFQRAIAKDEMLAKIYGSRLIEPDVKKALANDFAGAVQQWFVSGLPKSKNEILGTLIDFRWKEGTGQAVVRYAASGYRYSYHVYDLRRTSKGRLVIDDWFDYYQGNRFSDEAGMNLVMARPSRPATRDLLENKNLDDGEIFQVAELFKAVRDNSAARFFQIADGLQEAVLEDKTISRLALRLALQTKDKNRLESAVGRVTGSHPDDPAFSLRLIEYYIPVRQYQQAIDALILLQQGIGVEDGASESLKAAAAMAMGNLADAEAFALKATELEPRLELAWWSLLRARTRADDYQGAIEAMARLEDDFGKKLDPATLGRDPFLRVLADKPAYLDWRASRK